MRQADIKRGCTYMNWPDTATRTVTAIRDGVVYFDEVRRDWRPPKGRCGLNQFRGWAKKEVDALTRASKQGTRSLKWQP
jgi:hypothetical protein